MILSPEETVMSKAVLLHSRGQKTVLLEGCMIQCLRQAVLLIVTKPDIVGGQTEALWVANWYVCSGFSTMPDTSTE